MLLEDSSMSKLTPYSYSQYTEDTLLKALLEDST